MEFRPKLPRQIANQPNPVILYKCHLFGVNPPALTSSVATETQAQTRAQPPAHHSSAAWPTGAGELLSLVQQTAGAINQQAMQQQLEAAAGLRSTRPRQSDCSLCLNVDRKFQCAWCANQCKPADQCQELAASTCPPPRIDLVSVPAGR